MVQRYWSGRGGSAKDCGCGSDWGGRGEDRVRLAWCDRGRFKEQYETNVVGGGRLMGYGRTESNEAWETKLSVDAFVRFETRLLAANRWSDGQILHDFGMTCCLMG